MKCLQEEWPRVVAKAVDLDPACPVEDNARHLFEELAVAGGRLEVGYPDGRRTIFRTEAAELDPACRRAMPCRQGAVVLATGGARGITAEALRPLARPGVTLVLVGRIAAARRRGSAFRRRPGQRAARRTDQGSARGRRRSQPRPRSSAAAGAAARPRDPRQLARISPRPARRSSIAPPILPTRRKRRRSSPASTRNSAGSTASSTAPACSKTSSIVDKDAASWSRVVETKALSAFVLARRVRPETLRFFILFGSVAGRYGNSGQSDYAAANELLNRLPGSCAPNGRSPLRSRF